MERREANRLRYAGGREGHYESYFVRGNHPERGLGFWVRYTIFAPTGQPDQAEAELWAAVFTDQAGGTVAVYAAVPLASASFGGAGDGLDVRIGDAVLTDDPVAGRGALSGGVSSGGHEIRWDLTYEGSDEPVLLLAERLYQGRFPKAKVLVPVPMAVFTGRLTVDGEPVEVAGWTGSQNHNWGSQHTDEYAWGQVAGVRQRAGLVPGVLDRAGARRRAADAVAVADGAAPRRARVLAHRRRRGAAGRGRLPARAVPSTAGRCGRPAGRPGRRGDDLRRVHGDGGVVRDLRLPQPARRVEEVPQHQDRAVHGHAGQARCRAGHPRAARTGPRSRSCPDPVPGLAQLRSVRCSTSSPRPTRMTETRSGPNRPWPITPGVAARRAASSAGSSNGAVVVGDDTAVGAGRAVAHGDSAERAQGGREAEVQQFDRNRRMQRQGRLAGVGDDDEAVGRRGDDLLPGVGAAAALDQPPVGSDLVRAVDRDVQFGRWR